jgi:hypothetical protein
MASAPDPWRAGAICTFRVDCTNTSTRRKTMADCPTCGKKFDIHRSVDGSDATPMPGDFTICAGCAGPAVFTDTLDLRFPVDDETPPPGFDAAMTAVKVYRASRKARLN